ncbi:MAG: EamA family transporter RarD [Amphiplicatus sp.]
MSTRSAEEEAVRAGLLYAVSAYLFWGLFPAYLKLLHGVPALEMLAHRTFWAVPFGALMLAPRGQWKEVFAAFRSRRVLMLLVVTSLAVTANSGLLAWTVVHGVVLQSSLANYLNPLMYVAVGVLFMREKLRPTQVAAVILAGLGVLALAIGLGEFPWVSILMALLFTVYGYIRKTVPVGAMPGLFIETAFMAPLAGLYLFSLEQSGVGAFGADRPGFSVLLVLLGPMAAVPLMLFALGARKLKMSTAGILQYITPTGHFILGIYFGEAFTLAHAVCFTLIWAALILFSMDAFGASRARAAR